MNGSEPAGDDQPGRDVPAELSHAGGRLAMRKENEDEEIYYYSSGA